MAGDWRVKKLGDHCLKIGSGATPKGGKKSYLDTGPFRLIRSQNVYNEGFSPSGLAYIDEEQAKKLDGVAVEENDVLLNITGDSVARVCLAPKKYLPARVNQHVAIIRPDPNVFGSIYIRYFLASRQQQDFMLGLAAAGATRNALTKGMIEGFEIPAPSIAIQRSIGDTLGALDDRITLLRETNKTLEAIAQAIFKSWFIDFDPVRAKMEGRAPAGMDEETAALFPDELVESELGLVPKGWGVKALGDLIVPKRGKTITKAKCVEGDIPVVAGGLEPAYFHNQSNISSPVVTISASGANAGFVRLYQQDIWASDCSFIGLEQTGSIYFWYMFLKANQEKIYFMQQGAAQPHIYPSDLMRLNAYSSNAGEERVIFNKLASPLFKMISLATAKIKTLADLRDTLLPKLISGEIRAGKAEEYIEVVTT